MAQTVSVIVSAEDRGRFAAIVGNRSRPLKHIQRAWIVLLSAERLPLLEVVRRAGVSRPAVWRWQCHYAEVARSWTATSPGCRSSPAAPAP